MPALERDSQKIKEESFCLASAKENLLKGNNPDCTYKGILLYMKFQNMKTWFDILLQSCIIYLTLGSLILSLKKSFKIS